MRKKLLLLGLICVFVTGSMVACGNDAAESADISVETATGTYVGVENDGIAEFLGISYAAPIERWKAPVAPETTAEDVIEAKEYGPSCIQIDDEVEVASQWTQDEDCLDLNIWTKDVTTTDKPVMVFFHGGGNWRGGTYDPLYYGGNFVRNLNGDEDVVMVTVNFRLGIFGSLNLSGLEGYTDEYKDAINLNILDQIQALKWINENISSFGGDPDKVTIFGQSAGGGAVAALLTVDEARPYFHKVICESGNIFNREISLAQSEKNAEKVFDILGVSTIDELMAISDDEIRENYQDELHSELFHLGTQQRVADGDLVPINGYQKLLNGCAKDIDIMIGHTDGEKDYHASDWDNYPNALTDNEYIMEKIEMGKEDCGDTGNYWSVLEYPEVMDEYLSMDDDVVKRTADLFNDINFRQTNIFMADAVSQHNDNTYMYCWSWAPEIQDVLDYNGPDSAEVSPWGRAMHCMELAFVLNNPDGYPELTGDPKALPQDLMDFARESWYAFAKTGDPNNDLIPEWKAYDSENRYMMIMDDEWECTTDNRAEDTELLNTIAPNK